ncbi:MAG: HEPN domain-containing protein [Actinobacteria bacterium]|nr:HEPN domain-containing protein [Actinomycetota bacterium]
MKENVIKYRRKRAKEAVQEAQIMLENNKLIAAVNRIYYAIFYEVLALLLTKELSSSKHSGVRSLFNKEFIKTGIISEQHGEFYNRIFGFRQRADYEDFVEFDYEKVKSWFESAKVFIDSVEKVINETNRIS